MSKAGGGVAAVSFIDGDSSSSSGHGPRSPKALTKDYIVIDSSDDDEDDEEEEDYSPPSPPSPAIQDIQRRQRSTSAVTVDSPEARTPLSKPAAVGASPVNFDRLLGAMDKVNASPSPSPAVETGPSSDHLPSRLGKRPRSESPEPAFPPDLLEEITTVNAIYGEQCVEHYANPAVFVITFAKYPPLRVLISFPSNYPAAPPTLSPVDGVNDTFARIGRDIVRDTPFGKPCLMELVRRLIAEGSTSTERGGRPLPASHRAAQAQMESSTRSVGFPSSQEFEQRLELIMSSVPGYPPPLPEFDNHDGLDTAFFTEEYARHVFVKEKRVIEGNERLEYLGDSVLKTLTATALMTQYQLNESGMSQLRGVLDSNLLFAQFSKIYGFDLKTRAAPREIRDDYKKRADIFEAVVGGLYQDGANDDGGWRKLVKWFTPLIEPWIDWCLERTPQEFMDRWVTFNRIKLGGEGDVQQKAPKRRRNEAAQEIPFQKRIKRTKHKPLGKGTRARLLLANPSTTTTRSIAKKLKKINRKEQVGGEEQSTTSVAVPRFGFAPVPGRAALSDTLAHRSSSTSEDIPPGGSSAAPANPSSGSANVGPANSSAVVRHLSNFKFVSTGGGFTTPTNPPSGFTNVAPANGFAVPRNPASDSRDAALSDSSTTSGNPSSAPEEVPPRGHFVAPGYSGSNSRDGVSSGGSFSTIAPVDIVFRQSGDGFGGFKAGGGPAFPPK